jgi:hypothetical protein
MKNRLSSNLITIATKRVVVRVPIDFTDEQRSRVLSAVERHLIDTLSTLTPQGARYQITIESNNEDDDDADKTY